MILEIDCSPVFPFEVFESNSASVGRTRDVPGGGQITLREMPIQKRHLAGAESFITFALTFGRDVSVNLLASWLYDKLRSKQVRAGPAD